MTIDTDIDHCNKAAMKAHLDRSSQSEDELTYCCETHYTQNSHRDSAVVRSLYKTTTMEVPEQF